MPNKIVLLNLLRELGKDEKDSFKFFLRDSETLKPLPTIPKSQLEGATDTDLVDIIFQTYSGQAINVVKEILKEIPRNDLVDKLQKSISRSDEVDNQQQQPSIRGTGLDASKQQKKFLPAEVSSEVKVLTGALNINTSSKYDHITCKELIHSGSPSVYQLMPKTQNIGTLTKKSLGQRDPNKTNRTILLVGESGAGKSTLVNTLVNYAIGVTWKDNIWFEIVEEEKKRRECQKQKPQFTDVVVYEIFGFGGKTLPYSLTIIDTPGFEDTRGTEQDEIISQRLFDLFNPEGGVSKINVVGLVLKASESRFNNRLRYIFDSVASLFGKDMEEKIVALFTYSLGRVSINVLEALEATNIKWARNERNRPVHFLFDKCLHTYRKKDDMVMWETVMTGVEKFTDYLKDSEPIKLKATAEVLDARIKLTACVQKLQEKIQESEQKQTEFQQSLKKAQEKMKNNKEFMMEVYEEGPVEENISGGMWWLMFYNGAICCKVCKETCHYPCTIAWSPYRCSVMVNEHCTVCKGKCPVSAHVKEPWMYVTKTQKVKKENADMRKRYEKGQAEYESLQENLEKTKEELQRYKEQLSDEAFQHVLRLEQIALNTDSLSTHMHLDFLMDQVKERGDTEKVQKLQKIKSRVDEGTRAELRYKLTSTRK